MTTYRLFETYIGVDYSGAAEPSDPLPGLSIFRAEGDGRPEAAPGSQWSRKSVAEYLDGQLSESPRTVVGIDHGFSFPKESLEQYNLGTWDAFLEYFTATWQTDKCSVQDARARATVMGTRESFRLTEQWASSAKSVFVFDVPGQVGKSTHAGIPWLRYLRPLRDRVHFWPFDGFDVPQGKSVIAEVYPSIFKKRYPNARLDSHKLDAYAVCRWLQDRDSLGFLERYFVPQLSPDEKKTALVEGWILGIT